LIYAAKYRKLMDWYKSENTEYLEKEINRLHELLTLEFKTSNAHARSNRKLQPENFHHIVSVILYIL